MAKYPHVTVPLTGEDGNAFFIIGRTTRAMKRGGVSADEIKSFMEEATSGDYDHLLSTVMKWVSVD